MKKIKEIVTKEKIHAFAVHLSLSLVIFAFVLYFIIVEWYPQPLFNTDGGWQGIQIIAFVDIILGPVLTLVVYQKGKAHLRMDLVIIAGIQFAALLSGIFVVYNEHPVAVVLMENRLYPITAYQVNDAGIEIASLKNYSDLHPPLIIVNLPTDVDEIFKLRSDKQKQGLDLRLSGELYEKLTDKNKTMLVENSLSMDVYLASKPKGMKIFNDFLKKNKYSDRSIIYFPLYSRYEFAIAVLDKNTFEMLDILNIFPPSVSEDIQKEVQRSKN